MGDVRGKANIDGEAHHLNIFLGNEGGFRDIYEDSFRFLLNLQSKGAFDNFLSHSQLASKSMFRNLEVGTHSVAEMRDLLAANNSATSTRMALAQLAGGGLARNVG